MDIQESNFCEQKPKNLSFGTSNATYNYIKVNQLRRLIRLSLHRVNLQAFKHNLISFIFFDLFIF